MKKILIFIFIVSISHSAYSEMSTEGFYSMFGSAIGVISSNSCGNQTSYANKAEKAFEDLMDLGFNVEDRNAGHIFASAQTMLKNAIEAKNSKSDRKLRAIELQLKKLRLDQNESKNASYEHVVHADYVVSDRNSLINELTKKLIDDK